MYCIWYHVFFAHPCTAVVWSWFGLNWSWPEMPALSDRLCEFSPTTSPGTFFFRSQQMSLLSLRLITTYPPRFGCSHWPVLPLVNSIRTLAHQVSPPLSITCDLSGGLNYQTITRCADWMLGQRRRRRAKIKPPLFKRLPPKRGCSVNISDPEYYFQHLNKTEISKSMEIWKC